MKTKIYFLRDENRFVRYVGKTQRSLQRRRWEHIKEAINGSKNRRSNGIRAMLRRGFSPTIDLITEVENGIDAERAYIKWLRNKGIELWNGTDGGEGFLFGTKLSEEHKRKLSEAHKGLPPWNKGKKGLQTPWNKGKKGIPLPEKAKIKLSIFWKGKPKSEEQKRKISIAHIGLRPSKQTREKLSKIFTGRHHSPETKLKMSITRKGFVHSEQSKRNMSIGCQLREERKRLKQKGKQK